MKPYKCYFDGACEPKNPGGKIGAGVYITYDGKEYSDSIFKEANPINTNNIAEYMAFIRVLELMKRKTDSIIEIYGDSMLVINQMNGEWQIKHGAYREYALKARPLLEELRKKNTVVISWIPRESNEKADYQSMKAIGFERRKWK
jgi:ribonuclease HI